MNGELHSKEPNQKHKVSIIIPVYNSLRYIDEAMAGVCAQTYQNLEILLVDDGSTDGSSEYCDNLQENNPTHIRVFHKENGGAASARNYALARITGDYVMFVDSDDLVKPDYVEKMLKAAEETDNPFIICKSMNGLYHSVEEFYAYQTSENPSYTIIPLDQYRWTTGAFFHPTVWGALFSASLVKNIFFPNDLYVGEDTLFFAQVLKKAGKLAFLDEQYYYYRATPGSIVNSKYKLEHATEVTAWERLAELFSDQSEEFKNECEAAIALRCRRNYQRAFAANYPDKKLLKELYQKAHKRRENIFRAREVALKQKFAFAGFFLFPKVYSYLRNRQLKSVYLLQNHPTISEDKGK